MEECTKKRVGDTQTWPALRNFTRPQVWAARRGSASSKISTGAWPPSSIENRFMPSAHSRASCLPTGIEPVNDTFRMIGEAIRYEDTSAGVPVTTLTTPGGMPAAAAASAIMNVADGASSAGLMMMEQPAASAAAILRAGRRHGKFHGVKAATGPTGS
jgi:hypothetical protein